MVECQVSRDPRKNWDDIFDDVTIFSLWRKKTGELFQDLRWWQLASGQTSVPVSLLSFWASGHSMQTQRWKFCIDSVQDFFCTKVWHHRSSTATQPFSLILAILMLLQSLVLVLQQFSFWQRLILLACCCILELLKQGHALRLGN